MDTIGSFLTAVLGLDTDTLNPGQMAARTVITFAVTILILRLGAKRLFGKGTAFDIIVSIMIGSILSRAITGSSPLVATWAAGATLIGLHWCLAWLTGRVDWVGPLVKGTPMVLIRDGDVQTEAVQKSHVSRHDLEQVLLEEGLTPDLSNVALARLERDGTISIVTKERQPSIVDVSVEDGVQTVRVVMD